MSRARTPGSHPDEHIVAVDLPAHSLAGNGLEIGNGRRAFLCALTVAPVCHDRLGKRMLAFGFERSGQGQLVFGDVAFHNLRTPDCKGSGFVENGGLEPAHALEHFAVLDQHA